MIRYSHIRYNDKKAKDFTIAYEEDGNVIKASFAFCGKHDNFNKRIGREIAKGRLLKGRTISIVTDHKLNLSEISDLLAGVGQDVEKYSVDIVKGWYSGEYDYA